MDNQVKKFDIKKVGGFLLNNAVVIMIIISAIAVGISNPNFFGMYNIKNLLMNVSVRVVIAFGIAAVLIMRNNDLSAGRQVGFAGCIAATLLQRADYVQKVYPDLPELNWQTGGQYGILLLYTTDRKRK